MIRSTCRDKVNIAVNLLDSSMHTDGPVGGLFSNRGRIIWSPGLPILWAEKYPNYTVLLLELFDRG